MKRKRRYIWLTVAGVLVIAVVIAWNFPGLRSQSRTLPYSFPQVVAYLSHVFKTDLTEHGLHSEVWGPKFLDTTTHYFTETYRYTPGKTLRFQARFYQIGGEDNTFMIEALNDAETKLTVDQVVKFFLVFPYCTSSEVRILDTIEKDMKQFTEGPEQSPGAYSVKAADGLPGNAQE